MKNRVLSYDDLRQELPMKVAIAETKRAFSHLSNVRLQIQVCSRVHIPEQDGDLLTIPATLLEDGGMAVKVVSVFGEIRYVGSP